MGRAKGAPNSISAAADPPSGGAAVLLTRDAFRECVLTRDDFACVVCGAQAADGAVLDVHHILERRLFADGGYYLANGVTLCGPAAPGHDCHLRAEQTLISPAQLRAAAGIAESVLPPGFDDELAYDKWGNPYLPSGSRSPGPLFYEQPVQKMLREAGVLGEFERRFKYPRTLHLPNSPNRGADGDHALEDFSTFEGREVVVTLKLDGESTTCARDYIHARSVEPSYHPTRAWINRLHGQIAHEIPEGWRVCGENLYGLHSIPYDTLPTFFLVYAIFNERNVCLSWDETEEWTALLGLQTVPVLYRGPWDFEAMMACYPRPMYGGEAEGFVVRWADAFSYWDHWKASAKFVRVGHVKSDSHWRHRQVPANRLASQA